MSSQRTNFTFSDYSSVIMHTLRGNADEACEKAKELAVEAIQEKILYGYSTPHGRDGHTEIVDTGRLFDSITAEVVKESENLWTVQAGASSEAGRRENVDYAVYVHEGTYKLEARPFITDAVTDEEFKKALEWLFVTDLKQNLE